MRVGRLLAALAVAEEVQTRPRGAHGRAARRLQVPQGSLTAYVQEVEAELRVTLFAGKQRNELTEAGRILLENGPLFARSYETLVESLRVAAEP